MATLVQWDTTSPKGYRFQRLDGLICFQGALRPVLCGSKLSLKRLRADDTDYDQRSTRRHQPSKLPPCGHEHPATDIGSDTNDDFVRIELDDNDEDSTDDEGTGRGKAICYSKPKMTRTKASTRNKYSDYLLRKPTTTDSTKFWYCQQERWDRASNHIKYKISRLGILMEVPGTGVPASKPCQTCVSAKIQEVCMLPNNGKASRSRCVRCRCRLTRKPCDAERGAISDTGKYSMKKMAGAKGGTPMDHCDDSTDDEEVDTRFKTEIKSEVNTENGTEIKTEIEECNEETCPPKLHGPDSKFSRSNRDLRCVTLKDSDDVLRISLVPLDNVDMRHGRDVSRAGSIPENPRTSVGDETFGSLAVRRSSCNPVTSRKDTNGAARIPTNITSPKLSSHNQQLAQVDKIVPPDTYRQTSTTTGLVNTDPQTLQAQQQKRCLDARAEYRSILSKVFEHLPTVEDFPEAMTIIDMEMPQMVRNGDLAGLRQLYGRLRATMNLYSVDE